MAKLLKLRRGTTSQHSSFTGAEGEVTVDTTKDTVVVHDGSTAGGHPLAKESAALSLIDEDNMATDSATRPPSQQSVKAYVDGKVPTSITVADESSDTTCFPVFVTAATGDLAPKTGSNITFNSSSGLLTAVGLTLSGDLTVNGTTTTINSTTLAVDDKNIELGTVDTPSDTTADGGGITLKGATDKTITWVDSTDNWTFNQNIEITGTAPRLIFTDSNNDSDFRINVDGGSFQIQDTTNSSATRVAIDSSGRTIIGADSAITTFTNRLLQVVGDTNGGGVIAIGRDHSTLTSQGLGAIEFYGNDPGAAYTRTASISCDAAAEWTSNDYPSKLIFKTTPDGSSTNTIALTLDSSQNATFAGSVTDSKGDLRSIPANVKTSAYTLIASDAGKLIDKSGSGAVEIPNNVFSLGDTVSILNNSGSNLTITATITTLYNCADAATGNRTLAGRGLATIYFTGGTSAYISGAGLS